MFVPEGMPQATTGDSQIDAAWRSRISPDSSLVCVALACVRQSRSSKQHQAERACSLHLASQFGPDGTKCIAQPPDVNHGSLRSEV